MSPRDGTAAHPPIRRSGRIVCRIAIRLFGHDEEGNTFTERTHTVMLSLHGAGILSTHRFAPEQELILRIEETNREAVVRVVGEIAAQWAGSLCALSTQSCAICPPSQSKASEFSCQPRNQSVEFKVGDKVRVNLQHGKIEDAVVRAVIQDDDGVKLRVAAFH